MPSFRDRLKDAASVDSRHQTTIGMP
jgi:hypothetical protein